MALASFLTLLLTATGAFAPAARIVAEWDPGFDEAELGGPLVVDGYGINGLGAYRVQLDDGSPVLAVCIQADVGHSLSAEYVMDTAVALGPELGYLTWAYLRPGLTATDEQTAAVNALAWRYTDAQRRTGGSVWQGDELDIRVLGVGRLTAVEQAVVALHAEAVARRGPWALSDVTSTAGMAAVVLSGPAGPISGIEVRFDGDGGWQATAVTDAAGTATVAVPDAMTSLQASTTGPGAALAVVSPRSQRLAIPGPAVTVTAALTVPTTTTTTAAPTTSTSTTTTTTTTTTTVAPTTTTVAPPTTTTSTTTTSLPPTTTTSTTSTTIPATSTSTGITTTTTGPSTTVLPPTPTLPRTGSSGRAVSRWASILFAGGALAVLVATPRRQRPS